MGATRLDPAVFRRAQGVQTIARRGSPTLQDDSRGRSSEGDSHQWGVHGCSMPLGSAVIAAAREHGGAQVRPEVALLALVPVLSYRIPFTPS